MRLAKGKVLIFDLEARPTAWIGGDFVGRSLTGYAFRYLDADRVYSDVIVAGDYGRWTLMVQQIAEAVADATLVVGHWIRGFDLPLLNADLERIGQPSLGRMMTVDTKTDRLQGDGISQSLENLASRYDLETEKMAMHEPWWEEFNLWQTERTRKLVRKRVVTDVKATTELYLAMEKAGRLKSPAVWDPAKAKLSRYKR